MSDDTAADQEKTKNIDTTESSTAEVLHTAPRRRNHAPPFARVLNFATGARPLGCIDS